MSLHIAKRAKLGPNAIRTMFNIAKDMDVQREQLGLQPLISLGIGAPHIPSNPLMDIALQCWINKKKLLTDQIGQLQMELQSAQFVTFEERENIQAQINAKEAKLIQYDTYQPSQGTLKCRQAVADLVNYYYPFLNVHARQCCITNGGTQCLSVIFQVFVEPGVAVAGFTPFFPPYKTTVEALGGTWVSIPTLTHNCRTSAELLEQTLTQNPNVALIVLNDPCNPSGVKLTPKELQDIGQVLMKASFSHIIIVCDETYHDLIYSKHRELFLDVVDRDHFKSRTCLVLSLAKGLAGCPGLRFGIAYAPDMVIEGKTERIGSKLGILMLDATCAVSNHAQYVGEKILKAKIGKGNPEWVKISQNWEESILNVYKQSIQEGISKFTVESKFPLIVEPAGAFFGLISGKILLGKKVPSTVTLLDGRQVSDLPIKVGSPIFETDVHIAYYLLYAAEVVTVPASGFLSDPKEGLLRISFAVSAETLKEATHRMTNAANQVLSE